MDRLRALVVLAVLAVATLSSSRARADVSGDDLRVSIVTFGPGEHPFFRFGHNAVLIELANGPGVVYNFGMFNFGSAALIPKFILGRSMYWLARTPRDATFDSYIEDDRSIDVQELDLTPAQRLAIFQRLETNALPQNRYYLYDYFLDNCSTRVRDTIDAALGGQLKAGGTAPARLTYRQHALRLTADLTWEYLALGYALGLPADKPIDRFEEGFIPMQLRDLLRTVRIDAGGGQTKPLVKGERVVFKSSKPEPPLNPPRPFLPFALCGLAVGGLLAVQGWLARRQRWARVTLGLSGGLIGFVLGLLGALLVFLWVATNHRAAHANANILQSAPWAMALLVWGPALALGRARGTRRAYLCAASAVAASLLGLLLRIVGLVPQANVAFILFLLPIWIGMAWGFRQVLLGGTSPRR